MSDLDVRRLERQLEAEGRSPRDYALKLLGASGQWVTDRWPPERRYVLVHLRGSGSLPPSVVMGYCRHLSSGPAWVVPGVGLGGGVEAWADLIGDMLPTPPLWGRDPDNRGRGGPALEGSCQGLPERYQALSDAFAFERTSVTEEVRTEPGGMRLLRRTTVRTLGEQQTVTTEDFAWTDAPRHPDERPHA